MRDTMQQRDYSTRYSQKLKFKALIISRGMQK